MKPLRAILVGVVGLAVTGSFATAQGRMEVLRQEAVADVPGLRLVTIRDSQLAACYTLVVMEAARPGEVVTSAIAQPDIAQEESAQRIREATEHYNQQITDLNAQFEAKVGRPPLETWNNLIGWPYTFTDVVQYSLARTRLVAEYQHELQVEIPTAEPFATAAPGMKTGSWQDVAGVVQRAMAATEPATVQPLDNATPAVPGTFGNVAAPPSVALSGPFSCNASPEP